jgi:hypothetical protein
MTTQEVVALFEQVAIESHEAELECDMRTWTQRGREYFKIDAELKSREGDARRHLLPLLLHKDVQVRLDAATSTLTIDYAAARRVLEDVAKRGFGPQGPIAAMRLEAIDEGRWVPT